MSHAHFGASCCDPGPPQANSLVSRGASSVDAAAPAPDAAVEATDALVRELEDMSFDPALEGCCRRDVVQQIKSGHIKRVLQQADRSAVRVRMQQHVITRDPATLAAAFKSDPYGSSSLHSGGAPQQPAATYAGDSSSSALGPLDDPRIQIQSAAGDSSDPELAALRAARLQQLRAGAAWREGGRAVGYGQLNEVPAHKLLVRSPFKSQSHFWSPSSHLCCCRRRSQKCQGRACPEHPMGISTSWPLCICMHACMGLLASRFRTWAHPLTHHTCIHSGASLPCIQACNEHARTSICTHINMHAHGCSQHIQTITSGLKGSNFPPCNAGLG